jgi:hypothetical protein
MRTVCLAILLATNTSVSACLIEDVRLDPALHSAEHVALRRLIDEHAVRSRRTDTEFVGALYRTSNGVRTSVAANCAGDDAFAVRLPVPPGWTLIALWHTHGASGTLRDHFSEDDVALVKRTGLPFYLITASGGLRVLRLTTSSKQRALTRSTSLMPRLRAHPGEAVHSATLAIRR